MTDSTARHTCQGNASFIGAANHKSAATSAGATSQPATANAYDRAGALRRASATTSRIVATTPRPSNSQMVLGAVPFCKAASESAPNVTNSPWGTKTTRVTAKTSTRASASNA